MRLSDLAKGSSVFLGVILAGYVSTVYVDQRLTPPPANDGSACIGEGGSWKNWPWPNVPMGSPKCK